MSAAGRAYLQQIFNSAYYKAWAIATKGNRIDASKIQRRFAGEYTTKPGSGYAQGIWGLCGENPPATVPPPPPPPPPPSQLALVWQLDALFTVSASSFAGGARAQAKALGWRAVYFQLMHSVYAAANEAEISVFQRDGWSIVGWSTYGQGSDPYQDGLSAAQKAARLGLAGWKANGEAWAEGGDAWKTGAFVNGWRDGGAPCPLGWSLLSSDTNQFARNFDYGAALAVVGADIDIQVYGATHPTYTVDAGLGMLAKAGVPLSRTAMTFDVTAAGSGPFANYRSWAGPRRIWVGDYCTPSTFQAMVR